MRRAVLAALSAAFLFACSSAPRPSATPVDTSGDVRGCIATYIPTTNQFIYEPFIKIDSEPTLREDGGHDVWGFRVWNLEPAHADGLMYPVNVPEENFIPLAQLKQVGPKTTKCPPYWQHDSGIAPADHP